MTEKDIYSNGVALLEEWEDVNYCEHSFKFKDEWLTDKEVVDLLNELDEKYVDEFALRETLQQELQRSEEENEQLKIRFNEEREKSLKFCRNIDTLTIENEHLKNHIQELQNHLKRLENENISLKKSETATEELLIQQWQQNTKIKHTIKEAIYNERTELGKSVLKQLLNNIEAI